MSFAMNNTYRTNATVDTRVEEALQAQLRLAPGHAMQIQFTFDRELTFFQLVQQALLYAGSFERQLVAYPDR